MTTELELDFPENKDEQVYTDRNLEEVRELCEQYNCTLIEDDDKTLLLDLDGKVAREIYERVYDLVRSRFPFLVRETYRSRNGRGQHIIIDLGDPLPIALRLVLQAALGSDGCRETLAAARVASRQPALNVLFKPKPKTTTDSSASDTLT